MFGKSKTPSTPPCIHNWELVTKDILPSGYEQIRTIPEHSTALFFQKKIIIILKRTKCGILDKTIETNPEL
jgi:hypothetical protein